MELKKLHRLIRKSVEGFEAHMAEEGYEPDDEMDSDDVVESFKSYLDDQVEEECGDKL